MKVKRCSQVHLVNFPSSHFTPYYILTNFLSIPSFPHLPLIFTLSLGFTSFLINLPSKLIPYLRTHFP